MEIRRLNSLQSSRDSTSQASSITMQKKLADKSRRKTEQEAPAPAPAPDLTDFMNDMFFGTTKTEKKTYNLTGKVEMEEEQEFDSSVRSTSSSSSRMTQEWLEEARRMVAASSPSRCDSPSRLAGSPRFAAAQGAPSPSLLDRRDPISRSARRHRALETFSGEILSSAKHGRNKSESFANSEETISPTELSSPTSAVHQWFSNIHSPSNPTTPSQPNPEPQSQTPTLPPLQKSLPRRSRFHKDPSSPRPQGIPIPLGRNVGPNPTLFTPTPLLSPPKNLIESAQRRSISSSTCSAQKIPLKPNLNDWSYEASGTQELDLNGFLKEQRSKVEKILNNEADAKVKLILSGPSNSTSSMVAAICYAWLLENRVRKESKGNGGGDGEEYVMVPVMNVRREKMWKQRQVAWLFHCVGLDATSLFFADEVDLETLVMAGKLSMLVVGEDILRTNGEVGSLCTILTDNYCEDAYDLLQTPMLKKLMLAAILLDTQNLSAFNQMSMTRDAEAVQLLVVGSKPNYRNALFDQLMQDQKDNSFLEASLHNYGKPPSENEYEKGENGEHKGSHRKSTSKFESEVVIQSSNKKHNDARSTKTNKASPKSAKPSSHPAQAPSATTVKAPSDASRGKNKFFLAKWFGFGK
ncbi:hypothetical protein UlMin_007917 [Ulmus minor]